ncbi:MAG: serine/threonine-protein kinase, partial [Myxococcota bacterium]
MLQPGRVVDRYVIEAELGSGGMATVYKVRHARLRSVHALKVLKVQGSDLQARLVQEGQMQAQLRHPNIVAVTDVVDVDGAPGLVMDFVAGPPLDAWLREQPRPSLAEALRIFGGIVDAVARAHREGLVHRDLKPGNVLLEDGDRGLVPKVSDFGLAKILADSGSPLTRTRSGVAVGTPQYMAPEQVRDASRVDQRADIFALGCILYELTCGRSPFAHSDLLSTMNAVVAGDFPPPKEVAPGLPENVRAAIEGCLVVDRDRRIPDCATLVGVLAGDAAVERARPRVRVAADEPTSPSSDETLQPASKGTWAAIAVGGGALVAAAGFGTLAIALGAWWWLEAREAGEVAVAAPPPAEVAVAEPEPPPEAVTEPEPAPTR